MSVVFEIFNTHCKISGETIELQRKLRNTLRFYVEGAEYSTAFQMKKWDGYKYLYSPSSGKFHCGLLPSAVEVVENLGIPYTLKDCRVKPSKKLDISWVGKDSRYYQDEAFTVACDLGRGILECATGSGKTLITAKIFQTLGLQSFLIVKTKEAALDAYDELTNYLVAEECSPLVGCWAGNKKELGFITVCTVQSLGKADKSSTLWRHFLSADVFMADEVHSTSGADTWSDILSQSPAYYRFGQTGTAYRKDGKDLLLTAHTGRVIYKKKATQLQEEGFLAKSEIIFIQTPFPKSSIINEMVFMGKDDLYRAAITNNDLRNDIISEVVSVCSKYPTAIGVRLIEHGEILSKLTGVEFVNGSSPTQDRLRIRDGLKSGAINQIIGTSILDESVDYPRLKVFIDVGGYSPRVAQIQRLGRILRLHEGSEAIFVSFLDTFHWKMEKHSRNRIDYFKKEGHAVKILTLGEFYEWFKTR